MSWSQPLAAEESHQLVGNTFLPGSQPWGGASPPRRLADTADVVRVPRPEKLELSSRTLVPLY